MKFGNISDRLTSAHPRSGRSSRAMLLFSMLLTESVHAQSFLSQVGGAVTSIVAPVNTTITEAGRVVNTALTDAGRVANTGVTDAGRIANTGVTDVLRGVNTEITDAGRVANTKVTESLANKNAEITKGLQHAGEQAKQLNKDVKSNVEKAGRDTEAEIGRFGHELEDMGQAIGMYFERQAQGTGETLSNAGKRVREGKVVDALWHLAIEPLQHTSKNAALAAQESDYLNTVGQVAATAYGGPQGAAAYAAWLTYNQTGNADLAMRAGVLAWVTSSAMGKAGAMESKTTSQLAQKAAVIASIGGLAIAAAGGSQEAIKDGFLRAGAMVLVQDGYKTYTGHDLDSRESKDDAYCMLVEDKTCSPPESVYKRDAKGNILHNDKGQPIIGDISSVDPRRPHVGLMGGDGAPGIADESGRLMTGISKVPGMNAMALFHDQWVIQWGMDPVATRLSIVPAILLTYTGTGADYFESLRRNVASGGKGVVTAPPASPPATTQPSSSVATSPTTSLAAGAAATTLQVTSTALGAVATTEQGVVPASSSAFSTTSNVLAVTCASEGMYRSIVVDIPPGGAGACRITVLDGSDIPASQQLSESLRTCLSAADSTARQWSDSGAACFARDTVRKLAARPAPVEIRTAIEVKKEISKIPVMQAWVGAFFLASLVAVAALAGYAFATVRYKKIQRGRTPSAGAPA